MAAAVVVGPIAVMPSQAITASAATWSIALTSSESSAPIGTTVTLTAFTNQDVAPTPFWIEIYDLSTNQAVAICGSGRTCRGLTSKTTAQTTSYIAYVADNSTTNPPPNIQATSNTVTINWAMPSDLCTNPLLVESGSATTPVGAFYYRVAAQTGSAETIVCVRVNSSASKNGPEIAGGALIINTPGVVTVDNNGTACQNVLVSQGGVVIATGSDPNTGASWTCLVVGTVQLRVIVAQTITLPSVGFFPDQPL